VQYFLGIEEPRLFLSIVLHFGTLIAVVIYFRKFLVDVINDTFRVFKREINYNESNFKMGIFAVIASMPALCAFVVFKNVYLRSFQSIQLVSYLLIINGFILLAASYRKHVKKDIAKFDIIDAILIGCAQCIAIFPGISRSGTTITCAILCGIKPNLAFKFSFLLAIPAILGALIFDIKEIFVLESGEIFYYLSGMMISAVLGYVSLVILSKFLIKNKLYLFSLYCWIIGLSVVIWG